MSRIHDAVHFSCKLGAGTKVKVASRFIGNSPVESDLTYFITVPTSTFGARAIKWKNGESEYRASVAQIPRGHLLVGGQSTLTEMGPETHMEGLGDLVEDGQLTTISMSSSDVTGMTSLLTMSLASFATLTVEEQMMQLGATMQDLSSKF